MPQTSFHYMLYVPGLILLRYGAYSHNTAISVSRACETYFHFTEDHNMEYSNGIRQILQLAFRDSQLPSLHEFFGARHHKLQSTEPSLDGFVSEQAARRPS